jgi:hypothetical protein
MPGCVTVEVKPQPYVITPTQAGVFRYNTETGEARFFYQGMWLPTEDGRMLQILDESPAQE